MKIRLDYVTNSSSVSYAVATIQALEQMLLLGGVLGLSSVCPYSETKPDRPSDGSDTAPAAALDAPGAPDREMDWEAFVYSGVSYEDKVEGLEGAIAGWQAEWEAISGSLAAEDYDRVKQDYDSYIAYLGQLQDACGAIEDERNLEASMNTFADQYAEDWANNRKNDIVNVKNDIEEIRASIAGYQANGIDTDELEAQLAQLQGYERDLEAMLADEEIDFSYTAQTLDPIPPSPELIALQQAHDARMQQLLQQAADNEARKDEIRAQMVQNARDYQRELENAGFWGRAAFIAEVLSGAADMAVDVLAALTGPAGAVIKVKYDVVKNLGVTASEVAWDPDHASQHLVKGSIKVTTDLVKGRAAGLADGPGKKLFEFAVDASSDASQALIDEVAKRPPGETPEQFSQRLQSAAIKSTIKTTINTSINESVKYFAPNADVAEEFGDYNAGLFDAASRYGVTRFSEPLQDAAGNAAKDFITKRVGDEAKNTFDAIDKALETAEKGDKQ